ncbi:MAG TPA: CBM20 domain-containing protein, partial [Kofleriaceae bacterium]|nr:CBM20 domain-containing protein [Kofleriaceae bacterium]
RPAPASDVATIGAAELASGAFAPGIHETAAPPRVKTTIIVTGVDTADDEQVLVCGGLATLGDWEPANALAMQRDGAIWAATIEVPPGAEASFKFLRRSADGTVTWETGEDRRLVAKPRIEATWR